MKSRLTIIAMLVVGGVFSTAGAGLAVTGSGNSNNASVAQYATVTPTPTGGGVEGETGGSPGGGGHSGGGGVAGEQNTNGTTSPGAVQPARQVAQGASGSQLPFTGFAAIPVLVLGLGLLSAGLIVRRSSRDDA